MESNYPEDKRHAVDEGLIRYFPKSNPYSKIIYDAMRYSLFSGGKRFRPVLTLLIADLFRIPNDDIMPAACAIEMIHTYSLIHDDLPAIDDDDLRRGIPTCHIKFGDDIAILAGDALYAEAFNVVCTCLDSFKPENIIKVLYELTSSTGVGGMVGGQVVDIISSGRPLQEGDDTDILKFIHENKTGKLIKAAAKITPLAAGMSDEVVETVKDFAKHLGLAFQIIDDVLDITGETHELGKKTGVDVDRHKLTYPKVYGLERSLQIAQDEADQAIVELRKLPGDKTALEDLAHFVVSRKN